MKRAFFIQFCLLFCGAVLGGTPIPHAVSQWPMASGPHGTWSATTETEIPVRWSVSNDSNILWKRVLPEGGQSGISIWNDRVFFTINKPLPENTPLEEVEGPDIVGYCLNAENGKVEWTVDIPSPKTMPYSGLFSDNSSATPITDGKHVWFINHGGLMLCLDMEGEEVWRRPFESRTRHNAKQCEPMLVDDQLLFVMMRDSGDPLRRLMQAKPGARNTAPELWPWTFIRSFDAGTGKALWTESSGTSVHNTPRMGYVGGKTVVFHARGGGHKPPENPYGFSMSSVSGQDAGRELWNYESNRVFAYTVSHFDENFAYGFDSGNLIKLDARSGDVLKEMPLFERADIHLWNAATKEYEKHLNTPFSIVTEKFKKEPTNQTSILIGKYYLFMTHEGHCIGRVNTESGKVEYLQVPIQVIRKQGVSDTVLWDHHVPSDGANSRGMKTANDRRSERDGWGHVTAGSPIAVNEFVFFSTMIGMTYVIDSQKTIFDESALISVNDLGPAGETWSLSTPSFSQGRIFHRGLKQIVCIGSTSSDLGSDVPWDTERLFQVPKWEKTEVAAKPGMTGLLYDAIPLRDNRVQVFAYYRVPEGTAPAGGWPAMVCVHGGGGTAFDVWVQKWNDHGYAAISMDLEGHYPKGSGARMENPGLKRLGIFKNYQDPIEEQWYYHAVAQAIQAHSLIRSFPEVNADKIGITGISWGGTLTSTIIGVDPRFKFAIPVYGCGFIPDSDGNQGLAIKPGAYSDFVNQFFDGSAYFSRVSIPILWVNGTNDKHFPMPSTQRSAQAVSGSTTLRFELRMKHGHGAGWRPSEIYAFADSIVKDGLPLVKLAQPKIVGGQVTVSFSSASKVTQSELLYTRDRGLWPKRRWEIAPASRSGSMIRATVPDGAAVVFFNLIDERDLMVSSEFVQIQ